MNNKLYDIIHLISLVGAPTIAFIGSLCVIWNVPHAEQITASLTALDVLIGAYVVALKKGYVNNFEDHEETEYLGEEDESEA